MNGFIVYNENIEQLITVLIYLQINIYKIKLSLSRNEKKNAKKLMQPVGEIVLNSVNVV